MSKRRKTEDVHAGEQDAASTAVVNAGRLDYDRNIDFAAISGSVGVYHDQGDPSHAQILERVQERSVVVTKEIPIPAALIAEFPSSVKLIIEAGTGFNNIDLEAARAKGISVCSCPSYSEEAVAQVGIRVRARAVRTRAGGGGGGGGAALID
jgi:glycerate dehydrogenase